MKKEHIYIIKELTYYGSIGFSLSFAIFIGLGIGIYIDSFYKTSPWFTIIFLCLGIIAGYRNIGLAIKKSRKF